MAKTSCKPRSKRQYVVPRATFERLVKEITADLRPDLPLKWSAAGIDGLHQEAEEFLAEHFSSAGYVCDAFKRKTLNLNHFKTAQNLTKTAACPS